MTYGDNPIESIDHDRLNRKRSVETLCRMLTHETLETPIVVGINGEWGSGKTSVMRMMKSQLPLHVPSIWFDAWRYARQENALWRALLLAFVEQMRSFPPPEPPADWGAKLDQLVGSLYRTEQYEEKGSLRFNWKGAVPFAVQAALAMLPGGAASIGALREWLKTEENPEKLEKLLEQDRITRYREQVQSLEQFRFALATLVTDYLSRCGSRAPAGTDGVRSATRMYIFIDDLDRCLPDAVVETIEAIKLILDIPGCVFVLGIDRAVVEQGIVVRYRQSASVPGVVVESRQYLDKIIQIPFRLPALDETQIELLVSDWCNSNKQPELIEVLSDIVVTGVAPNPRSVKRTLNLSRLMVELRSAHKQEVDKDDLRRLVKLVVLQNSYEVVYQQLVQEPSFLKRLEASADADGASSTEAIILKQNPRLRQMLRMPTRFDVLAPEKLRDLIYLTRISG